ncbi:hypothetical protein [[Clostridium] fimetarium]|uniref:Uncharacterized protein n=1 Tax=[Clostridium] fimetarium TaxID=99656 RepID=A0A1I0RE00_9FIRM|nr:hypothetical protein [[Clostridium] fimetarium]SEW38976.1 hypothetical protein SAMN05421659_11473 [[Clostridium] fimetarium]
MKYRNFLTIILLNFMFMCLLSLYMEYATFNRTTQRLMTNFDLAVESAINLSTGSEEFFSDKFNTAISSQATSIDKSKLLYATTKVYRDGNWITGNIYLMSMYYNQNGAFPESQTDYNMYASGKTSENIFEYLFGKVGTDYSNADLKWANNSSDISIIGGSKRQVTNTNFLEFYTKVGYKITSNIACKQKNENSWTPVNETVPTLTQMGLRLNPYNEVTSQITNDNFTTTAHQGTNNSVYYLTPASMGVTYIPIEVLKPTVLSNLEQMIRFSKCGLDPLTSTSIDINKTYASAEGCIATNVYDDGNGGASSSSLGHRTTDISPQYTSTTDMLNDGYVEYDMSTLKVKVDYFVVDFYDTANWKIANDIYGAIPNQSDLTTLPSKLKAADTTQDKTAVDGNKIVARVTVKCKIHIPYRSSLLQWFINITSDDENEHYDIKLWDEESKSIVTDSDGVWYQYSTYYVTE